LRLEGLEAHPEAFGTSAQSWREGTREKTEAVLRDSEGPGDDFVLGAFEDDALLGVLGFRRETKEKIDHKGTLWGFYVRHASQGRGVGTTLLKAALERLRAIEGLAYARLIVSTANEAAVNLFSVHGFERYGLEEGGIHASGRVWDQAYMKSGVLSP
jgi:ribosomal protein S18 acetylase RimI-like enzyme